MCKPCNELLARSKTRNREIMKQKEKYIGGFLDGYFTVKKSKEYGMDFIFELEKATAKAEKKWKQYKNKFKNK